MGGLNHGLRHGERTHVTFEWTRENQGLIEYMHHDHRTYRLTVAKSRGVLQAVDDHTPDTQALLFDRTLKGIPATASHSRLQQEPDLILQKRGDILARKDPPKRDLRVRPLLRSFTAFRHFALAEVYEYSVVFAESPGAEIQSFAENVGRYGIGLLLHFVNYCLRLAPALSVSTEQIGAQCSEGSRNNKPALHLQVDEACRRG